MSAYRGQAYATTLSELGRPLELVRSRSWVLVRPVPETGYFDAIGPYPLFACDDWDALAADLEHLEEPLLSLVVVTDPFHPAPSVEMLSRAFPDRHAFFKDHLIADLGVPRDLRVSDHHRRYARAARRKLVVERCASPPLALEDWTRLYGHLIAHHDIRGLTRFSTDIFRRQLALPDLLAFRASDDQGAVAMALFLVDGDRAYYHLGASSSRGYAARASFGVFDLAFEVLGDLGVRFVDLGAGPSVQGDDDGLVRFKRGWSTGSARTWLGGRVVQRRAYDDATAARGVVDDQGFFPAYRSPL